MQDNPAIAAALTSSLPVEAIYLNEQGDEHATMGAASRWYLHYSLIDLRKCNYLGQHEAIADILLVLAEESMCLEESSAA